eukprot:TRINITY_DN102673_c0_g1_i1.p1 TRINITY_DN102673_c0_g1~~TRINITY_DN102673_c0_g1_i1.p1  ORF type:complete len:325 (+),score=40.25 TRINITY_DN102673_c0_g1_i1:184-1158(+)
MCEREARSIFKCSCPVASICVAPELGVLAAGDSAGSLHLLDSASGQRRCELSRSKDPMLTVDYAHDVRAFVSASGSVAREVCAVTVWDADSGDIRAEMNYQYFVTALTYAAELRAVITGAGSFSQDKLIGQVVVWNIDSLEQHRKFRCTAPVTSVIWNPSRRAIICGDRSQCIRIWSAESGEMMTEISSSLLPWRFALPLQASYSLGGGGAHAGGAYAVALCNFKANLGEVNICDGEGRVQNAERFESSPVLCLTFLPEPGIVACGCRNGEVVLWDYESRARRRTVRMSSAINAMVYNPTKGELVVGAKSGEIGSWPLAYLLSD